MKKFTNVWDALEDSSNAAESMKARAAILMRIEKTVRSWEISQSEAARRLGITQPRVNDLLRGKIDKFSLDSLFDLATHAGLKVSLAIRRAA
jgi:predicted XRE-type DNA-binding protein